MASIQFGYTAGLWALLSLIPLIILYLIKPRPKVMEIPSLMFFMRSTGYRKLTSFLRTIVRDWLFLIQLLLVTALALTFAKPFSIYLHDVTAQNTVLIIDVSASSQARDGLNTRFDIGLAKAKNLLASKNTIILAKDSPLIGIKDASYDEALTYLTTIKPKDTTTRLGEAVLLAGETLGSEGRVIVISDFINTDGQDPTIAKTVLESKGLIVDFITTASQNANNVGMIDLAADETSTTVYIKNFDTVQRAATLTAGNFKKELAIAAHSIEQVSLQTPEGLTKITLEPNDDFPLDNILYLSAPIKKQTKALLITNNASVFLKNALTASGDVKLDLARPPILPQEAYDIYILHALDQTQLLPGTLEDIANHVANGATIIIHVQDDSPTIDYKNLLPVGLSGKKNEAIATIDQLNRFTKNIEFGRISYYFSSWLKPGTVSITSADNTSLIAVGRHGNGKLIYYGIPEHASDFKFSPSYPIFWTELIRFVTDQQEVKNLNYKTGDTLLFDTPLHIETPHGVLKQPAITLDVSGTYTLPDRIIAANLVNEKESNINTQTTPETKPITTNLKPIREQRHRPLEFILAGLALTLLIFELYIIKRRGDL